MKRLILWSLVLLAGLFAACSDVEEIQGPSVEPESPIRWVPMTIEVGEHPDANPLTRISLEGDKTLWEVGDQIAVKFVDAAGAVIPAIFTIDSADKLYNNGKSASFSGAAPVGSYAHVAALYPATGRESATTQFSLTQTDADNLFLSAANNYAEEPMLVSEGVDAPSIQMQFEHIMHKIDFTLKMGTGFTTDDFDPSAGSESKQVVIEMTVKSSTGLQQFPLLCTYDVVGRQLEVKKTARANSLILSNHDFDAEPTVSMLLFPQDFGEEVTLTFNIYINGVKRYQIGKPATGSLPSLKMSPGRSTSVSLTFNEEVKVEELSPENPIFGDGSEHDPYVIVDFEDLTQMSQMLETDNQAGKYYMLVADIDLGDTPWQPAERDFCGTLDGNGYTITVGSHGFAGENSGLFYSLGDGATMKNLNLVCAETAQTGGTTFGLLANRTQPGSVISNCHASGDFSGDKTGSYVYWGGLVGTSYGGVIDHSSFTGSLKGDINNSKGTIGGLVAEVDGPTVIINSYVSGLVANDPKANGNGKSLYVGGFIGKNNGADILNCYSRGTMYALTNSANVGGFIGLNTSGNIDNCYSDVDMESIGSGSGVKKATFIAERDGGNITHCYDLTGKTILPYPDWRESDNTVSADYEGASQSVATLLNQYAADKSYGYEGSLFFYSPWTLTRGGTMLELIGNLEPVEE